MTARPSAGAVLADSAAIFSALGDETRLGLVARLGSGGPQSIARLTGDARVTRQAITKHLLVLARAGLVRSERQGRETRWELEPDQLEVARRYLDFISEQWSDRLDALARHLDATAAEERPKARRGGGRRR